MSRMEESTGKTKGDPYGLGGKPFIAPKGYAVFCGVGEVASAFNLNSAQARVLMGPYHPQLVDGKTYWTVAQVVQAAMKKSSAPTDDPSEMAPNVRKDYYDAELKRLKYEQETGELINTMEALETFSSFTKSVASHLETLPDVLERDAGLTGSQIEVMRPILDRFRRGLVESTE